MGSDYIEFTEPSSRTSAASRCSYVPPEPSRLVLDPNGDLGLKVGETRCVTQIAPSDRDSCSRDRDSDHEHELPVIYIVCSRTLSRVSPVWKALLYGGFAESKSSSALSASNWVVELPDDNPKAMATLLNIIHSRFESIPRTTDLIDLEDLYELTVLTDKYDLTATLQPWAFAWVESIRIEYEKRVDIPMLDLERLSWIARETGDVNLYKSVSRDLAHRCSTNANGDLQYEARHEVIPLFSFTLEPPGYHDELKSIRLSSIKNVLEIYEKAVVRLLEPVERLSPATICKLPLERWECEPAMLGTMIRSLAWSGYWPLPAATDVREDFNGARWTTDQAAEVPRGCEDGKDGSWLIPPHPATPHPLHSSNRPKLRGSGEKTSAGLRRITRTKETYTPKEEPTTMFHLDWGIPQQYHTGGFPVTVATLSDGSVGNVCLIA
ncbi:hypothetical protein GQX73_g6149 [Xylaria multiplex]|uniref:BTB domain-containing protein n=1 Tax=Xylaria multiplex TaxID=323545 RepID=A0A7C8IMF8_9PEZI|nr:hypothetical protein GQX73_g6149 [Xylaria multiplex]